MIKNKEKKEPKKVEKKPETEMVYIYPCGIGSHLISRSSFNQKNCCH